MKCFNWYTSVSYVLISVCLSSTSVHESYCPSQVSGLYGEEGMISCYFRPNFQTIIWFDETSTRDPLIRLEHSTKSGRGYDSGKYDVLQNGSLVIKTIDFINEQQYITVAVIFGSTNITEFSIVFFVIEHCPTQQSGFFGETGNIICHFKPNFNKVSWYLEQDKPLLQMKGSHISGSGYESEKYSVTQNGSLVIRRVTEENKAIYTVILIDANNISTVHRVEFKLENYCPSQVSGLYGEEGMISCYFRPNFQTIIWFDETSTRDPLIRLEHNTKSGRGYDSGKYDVLQNGSLVIKTIEFINEQQYITVAVIFGSTKITEFSILFFVIEHCPTQQSGFFGEKGNIICHFKPNFNKVSWYVEQDKPLLQMEGSHISGLGYENEKYSVKQNGSLVMRRLTEENEAIYTVILVDANYISTVHRVEFKLETGCWGSQYGYFGTKGIINCNFEPGYEDVYWYDDTIEHTSIIRLENGVKSGKGYDSNEYDVAQNGSLVIKNVQLKHEQEYKVIRYDGEHQITEYRIMFCVIGAGVTSCWSNGTASTNPVFAVNHCASPQHGYLGKEGIISCNIDQDIDEVYWFNETDEYHHPFIRMESGHKSGSGYKSNEYDILQNGSLIIRNVQYKHQQSYKVTFENESQVDLLVNFYVRGPTTSNSGTTLPSEVTSIVQSTKGEDSNRGNLYWIWIVVVPAVVVVLVVIKRKSIMLYCEKRGEKGKGEKENPEEGQEML